MDNIINKLTKKIPLAIVIGCFMIEYKVLPSIFYPGFDNDLEVIEDMFKSFKFARITEGTVITSDMKLPFSSGSYGIEKISEFLGYPCGLGNNKSGFRIKVIINYDNQVDTLLTMYCDTITDKVKRFIGNVEKFTDKMNNKLTKKIDINVLQTEYFTVKVLRDIIDLNKRVLDSHKVCIEDILTDCGYGLLLSLHEDKQINMYDKKCRSLLSLLLRLCELEKSNMFNPNDKDIKVNTIITKLKEAKIYNVKAKDKKRVMSRGYLE